MPYWKVITHRLPSGLPQAMNFPYHRTFPSGLRLPPLSMKGRACSLLTTPCVSLNAEIDAMCADEGVGPVVLYLLEPDQHQHVEPAALAFQSLQGI